jgi:predicted MFS family arabinose efflux permease
MYLILTTVSSIFEGTYHRPPGIAGLHYVALGVGIMTGAQMGARILDRSFKYLKAKNDDVSIPEHRVRK